MEHNSSRAEAERWLYTANKLLSARDLHGARSFAIRARESDPTFDASELLLTVIDTIVAGENRINDQHDWYGILQVLRYTQNIDYIASQYRRLALLLDPHRNLFAFSGHAFTLVHDAWSVLSNPAKKVLYDNHLRMVTGPVPAPTPDPSRFAAPNPSPTPSQRQQQQQHQQQLPLVRRNPRSEDSRAFAGEERPSLNNETTESARQTRNNEPTRPTAETEVATTFWTACPYCYFLHEYPKVYEECTLRCQSCRRGFHAVMIPSPPVTGKDAYFCCWGFFPLGFSGNFKDISGLSTNWNPFSSMFACPLQKPKQHFNKGPWVFYDDDAAFVDLSDSSEDDSDDDWRRGSVPGGRRKRARKARGRGSATSNGNVSRPPIERPRRRVHIGAGHGNLDNGDGGSGVPNAARAESSKKVALGGSRRRGAADLGKLDLNVEFSNEVEDPNPARSEGNGTGNVAEDNIEGIGFFEGLDEFLSSLPLLNVVADDKVKGH